MLLYYLHLRTGAGSWLDFYVQEELPRQVVDVLFERHVNVFAQLHVLEHSLQF